VNIRGVLGFVFAALAACAISFGLDLLVASAVGYYPAKPYGSGLIWLALGTSFHLGARKLSMSKSAIIVPYTFFGGLAVLSGVIGSQRFNVLVGLPLLLVAALYARQGATRGPVHQAKSFPIGTYAVGESTQGIKGLSEFSPQEYALMPKEFKGAANYNAPPVMFLGRSWKMSLGTVNGRIYKVAPYMELNSKLEASKAAMAALQFCTEKLGRPAEQETGLFTWDTSDGNVILQTFETAEGLAINLFITSSAVWTLEPAQKH
jgi:hypothetical protein